jgi:hypothetical protein
MRFWFAASDSFDNVCVCALGGGGPNVVMNFMGILSSKFILAMNTLYHLKYFKNTLSRCNWLNKLLLVWIPVGTRDIMIEVYHYFPQSRQSNGRLICWLGQDLFFPVPFQFIIQTSSYHQAVCSWYWKHKEISHEKIRMIFNTVTCVLWGSLWVIYLWKLINVMSYPVGTQ